MGITWYHGLLLLQTHHMNSAQIILKRSHENAIPSTLLLKFLYIHIPNFPKITRLVRFFRLTECCTWAKFSTTSKKIYVKTAPILVAIKCTWPKESFCSLNAVVLQEKWAALLKRHTERKNRPETRPANSSARNTHLVSKLTEIKAKLFGSAF